MNLIEALDEAGVAWKPHKSRAGEIYLCCPFCTERHESQDYRFRLSVNYMTGMGHCHNCQWSSRDSIRALSFMLKLGQLEPAEYPYVSQKRPERCELPEEYVPLDDVNEFDPFWKLKKYLLDRGVTEKQILEKKIGGALSGQYRYSVIFPVYYGEIGLCGFVSRDVTGNRKGMGADGKLKDLRYLNNPGTKVAYNVPYPVPRGATVVVSEGIFKALAIERCFGPRQNWISVSTQGDSISDVQVTQFAGAKEVVVFCDPGSSGRIHYLNAVKNISHLFERVSLAYPLPSMQADELPRNKIIEHLTCRRRATEGLIDELKSKELLGASK